MNLVKYIATSAAVFVALFIVIVGLMAVVAIFGGVSWDDVWSNSAKIGLVMLVLFVLNLILGTLVNFMSKSGGAKK